MAQKQKRNENEKEDVPLRLSHSKSCLSLGRLMTRGGGGGGFEGVIYEGRTPLTTPRVPALAGVLPVAAQMLS